MEQHAFRREPVAARAPGLLAVLLEALGQRRVQHEAHVGAVDAHAEGHGRDDHVDLLVRERVLRAAAHLGVETGVVGDALHAALAQRFVDALDLLARDRVDDAGLATVARQHAADLLDELVARLHAVDQVRPVAGGHEHERIDEAELALDVAPHVLVGGGGESLQRHERRAAAQLAELAVLGPEIVAPVADAVRLVDRDRRQAARNEALEETLEHEAFGRGVEQLELAALEGRVHGATLLGRLRAGQHAGRHAALGEAVDLVLHQRDQRADDQRQPLAHQRRRLEAQALAPAGGQYEQQVAPGQAGCDGLLLERTQTLDAEAARHRRAQRAEPEILHRRETARLPRFRHGADSSADRARIKSESRSPRSGVREPGAERAHGRFRRPHSRSQPPTWRRWRRRPSAARS